MQVIRTMCYPGFIGLALVLSGCFTGTQGLIDEGTGEQLPQSADLCVDSTCGEVARLLAIPDAENIHFSPSGRLFVSGGLNVYEVNRSAAGAFSATALADRECSFTGMAVIDNILYAVGCQALFAGELTESPSLTPIYAFVDMCIPNGMVAGPEGRLYVVDEPLLADGACVPPDPKIVRLRFAPGDPYQVLDQEVWVQGSATGQLHLGLDNVLRFPNGLVRDGLSFYGTDGGSVFSVAYQPDGTAGEVTPVFFEEAVHDDLGLSADGILVTHFDQGRIALWSRDGRPLAQTNAMSFVEPSSVRLGRPPMFKTTDILVTEKGVITEQSLPLDYLSLFQPRMAN